MGLPAISLTIASACGMLSASDIVPDGPIPWSSDDMVTFGTSIREGFFDEVTDCIERITGRPPHTLRSVFEQYQGAWPK